MEDPIKVRNPSISSEFQKLAPNMLFVEYYWPIQKVDEE